MGYKTLIKFHLQTNTSAFRNQKPLNVVNYKKRAGDKTRYLKLEYLMVVGVTSLLQLIPGGRKLKPIHGEGMGLQR